MKNKLVYRLLLPVGAAVAVMIGLFSYFFVDRYEKNILASSRYQLDASQHRVAEVIDVVDDLSRKRVGSAMRMLQTETARLGRPRPYGSVRVGSETVPNLAFGASPQANEFTVVDRVNAITGAAATVFVRRGNDFVRISTNVKKADGTRAVGTLLDPNGKAIAAVRQGSPFYGVVDILGKPYITGYEPVTADGAVVGILYVGYQLSELDMLRSSIEESRILTNGFSSLLDKKGTVLFHSSNISADSVTMLASGAPDWEVSRHPIDRWGYTVIAGYPVGEVESMVNSVRFFALAGTVITILLLVGIIYAFFQRLIVLPVNAVVAKMQNADIQTLFADDRPDEIGHLQRAFDGFVGQIKETLQQVSEASAAVASASTQISSSTEELAAGAQEQSSQATEVAGAVEEMT
ncbi:MAG: methyl-accepting chemotaxis protein, partial [Bacteroidetes bacterium]